MQRTDHQVMNPRAMEQQTRYRSRRIRLRLEFRFASLSAIGGIVLAAGQGLEGGATLAIFFALCGFLFVDWLRVFELPPLGAYLAMGSAAAYCVYDFWGLQQQGERQMGSVAMLLVLVQGVLMMQRKSRRILEQMAVFCLLELVVAAIFSDAIHFGLWLIPIALVGGSALSLLSFAALTEEIDVTLDPPMVPTPSSRLGRLINFLAGRDEQNHATNDWIATASPRSATSLQTAAGPWSRYALLTLSPSILLIAAAFFYVLPRKVPPSRSMASGPALVGFDDEIRMEQLGQVMQNSALALKIKLTRADNGDPYLIDGSLYVRGNVLEEYQVDHSTVRPVSKWVSTELHSHRRRSRMPPAGANDGPDNHRLSDDVHVQITCEPMNQPALFSIAPYHLDGDSSDVVHAPDRWTLVRDHSEPPFPRIRYEFGTHAFHLGKQTRSIDYSPETRSTIVPGIFNQPPFWRSQTVQPSHDYMASLLQFDRRNVPTARRLALQIIDQMPAAQLTHASAAEAMQQFLKTDPQFSYTLNLNAVPVPGMDPVEQFLSLDRRGHCQYFASSLALMLRSIGIPCRLVVGYRTEEYNNIGKYCIVRQSHAHAWVEALVERNQIPADTFLTDRRLNGRSNPDRHWLQLDPTPALSEVDDGNPEGVDGLMNLANNIWEDYVVEMDGQRQHKGLVEAAGLVEVGDSYQGALGSVRQLFAELKSERLASWEIAWQLLFPLCLVVLALALAATWLATWTAIAQNRLLRRKDKSNSIPALQPGLRFYATVLEQLQRVGIRRSADETPTELYHRVGAEYPQLESLTHWFERLRYGHFSDSNEMDPDCQRLIANSIASLTQSVDRDLSK